MNYHLTWIMSVFVKPSEGIWLHFSVDLWIPSRIDLMSFRPMGGLCSTVLAPLAHCSVFQPWFLAVTGFLSERKQRKHQENYKSWELDLVVGLENYMLHTVQQNIEHFIWRDDAWIHSRSNHSRSSSLCSSNRESCNLLGLILAIYTVYVGSTPPPRIPVTTRIVNIFDRESLQAICLKTTGWGVRSDVFFPNEGLPLELERRPSSLDLWLVNWWFRRRFLGRKWRLPQLHDD